MIRPVYCLLPLAFALLSACAPNPVALAPSGQSGASGSPAVSGSTVSCDYRATSAPAKAVDPPSGTGVPATGTQEVTLVFAGGPVTISVDQAAAPCTAHSFVSLARQGYFTNTKCHRLVTGPGLYVLQCGDPSGQGTGGPGYWFNDELAHTAGYPAGTVAMANAGPNTNGSQFFIVYADSTLPPKYTVFGHVEADGVQVVQKIADQGVTPINSAGDGAPRADTTIRSVTEG